MDWTWAVAGLVRPPAFLHPGKPSSPASARPPRAACREEQWQFSCSLSGPPVQLTTLTPPGPAPLSCPGEVQGPLSVCRGSMRRGCQLSCSHASGLAHLHPSNRLSSSVPQLVRGRASSPAPMTPCQLYSDVSIITAPLLASQSC